MSTGCQALGWHWRYKKYDVDPALGEVTVLVKEEDLQVNRPQSNVQEAGPSSPRCPGPTGRGQTQILQGSARTGSGQKEEFTSQGGGTWNSRQRSPQIQKSRDEGEYDPLVCGI